MEIRNCALKYLAGQSRTAGEMERHLSEKGYAKEEIKEELQFLIEYRYMDDLEYSRRYLEIAFEKGKGIGRIKNELSQKGVSPEVIEDVLHECGIHELAETERERALAIAEKMSSGYEVTDKLLAKIGRKLSAQGYESGAIYNALGKLMHTRGRNEENGGSKG